MAASIKSQEQALKVIKKIVDNYVKSAGKIRPHFLVSGSSGSGKSWIIEGIANKYGITTLNINAAQLTREGIAGNSLSKSLEPLKKLQGKPVIVFLDEFDKLFNGVNGSSGDERSGVQAEILHNISSGSTQVIADYGKYAEVNTSNVLFVFAGAFMGEENLSPEKLLRMGMFPELLGRVNIHVGLPTIDCEELVKAMRKDELLYRYFDNNQVLDKDDQEEIKDKIAEQIRINHPKNVIGYRMIQRLIHQYFLFDGVFPVYEDEVADDAFEEEDDPFRVEISKGE